MIPPELTIDRLRRIQATLQRRVARRDPPNIRGVGFAPPDHAKAARMNAPTLAVTAQFDVLRKRQRVTTDKRIAPQETLRLFNREANRYDTFAISTDVVETGEIVPSGVRISTEQRQATTSVVVRWTTASSVPPRPPHGDDSEDPRWRWGVITVSHLFSLPGDSVDTGAARVQRVADCGAGPKNIRGRVLARGRIPGGPDIALVETGLERLWLSGFLSRPDAGRLPHVTPTQLARFASTGTEGDLMMESANLRWRWLTFYPELEITGLGHLRHIVRYQIEPDGSATAENRPLRLGTSGSLLIAGGVPIGIQVASTRPDFKIGYAQTLDVSLAWLAKRLSSTALEIVDVVAAAAERS